MLETGRYDDLCQAVAAIADASSIVLLIVGGNAGSGVSIGALDRQYLERLPGLLHFIADDLKQRLEQT